MLHRKETAMASVTTATTTPPARPRTTTAMCAAMQAIGGGLGWSLLPPLMPTIARDLSITHSMGGLVWGAAPLGIALAAPLGGAAVDRFGARRVAGFAMLIGALACASRALAFDGWTLALSMFVFGLHVGFVAPAVPKALAGHVPLTALGRANGLALLGYTLGTAATVLTARTMLMPLLGGWRPTMVFAAAAMALMGVLWLLVTRDRIALSRHASLRQVLSLARDRQLLRVAAIHFLLFGGYLALLGLLPRALWDAGMKPQQIGLAVAGWLVCAGIANFAGPWLSDRIGLRRPILLVGAALAGSALGLMALLPSGAALGPLALAALGGGVIAPLVLSLPMELPGIGVARAGGALGLLMLVGQVGGFLFPLLTGAIAGRWGFAAALGLLAVGHAAIIIPALGLRETGRNRAQVAPAAPAQAPARVVA